MDELYLDNIDEFVNDHNKVVTYKWLSLTLGVHVNIAKQMLFHYLDHKRKESSAQLHATYLVSGKCVENGHTNHKVSVVREEQLEDVKSRMQVTVSVHVYSVQKAALKDSAPLYSVDYDAVKDNMKNCSKYSAIHCANAVPMSSVEVHLTRESTEHATPKPQSTKPDINRHASKPSAKPPKGIMGMFANKPAPKTQEGNKEAEAPKNKPCRKTNQMSNFFGTQATKSLEEEERPSSSSLEQRPSSPLLPQEAVKRDARSKSKRVEASDSEEEEKEKKRRRRIKNPQPDSSDEDGETHLPNVPVIPESPQQQDGRHPLPSPGQEIKKEHVSHPDDHPGDKRKKRRRVLKSRTFVDDDGSIVTEKAYESESYSESEADVQDSKPSKDPVTTKPPSSRRVEEKSRKKTAANANKGTKQASIMGFFQKK